MGRNASCPHDLCSVSPSEVLRGSKSAPGQWGPKGSQLVPKLEFRRLCHEKCPQWASEPPTGRPENGLFCFKGFEPTICSQKFQGPRVESALLESSLPAQDRRSHRWKPCLVSDTLTAQSWADRGHSRKALDSFSIIQLTLSSIYSISRDSGETNALPWGGWSPAGGVRQVSRKLSPCGESSWREERSTPSLWGCIA